MQRQIAGAILMSLLLVVGGYVVFGILFDRDEIVFEQGDTNTKPLPALPKIEPPATVETNINVISVEGEVRRRKGDSSWTRVQQGEKLTMDEAVQTEGNGRAVMDIGSTATVEVTPNSSFTVKEITSSISRVRVNQGRVSAVVHGKDGSKLIVESQGSDATAVSEKGKFSVLSDGQGQVAVATESGSVELSAQDEKVTITDGLLSVVQPGRPPAAPISIPKSLFLKVGKPRSLVLREKETAIAGTTNPGAVVSINSVRVAVDAQGKFRGTVPLQEGRNKVTISVEHVSGMVKEKSLPDITVDSKPPRVQSSVQWGKKPGDAAGTP